MKTFIALLFFPFALMADSLVDVIDYRTVIVIGPEGIAHNCGRVEDAIINRPTLSEAIKEKFVASIVTRAEKAPLQMAEEVKNAEECGCDVPAETKALVDAAVKAEEDEKKEMAFKKLFGEPIE